MTLTTRILPRDEWGRLDSFDIKVMADLIQPGRGDIIVVESDGEIVGHWAVYDVVHVEGLWLSSSVRHTRAPVLLLKAMKECAAARGARAVVTASIDPKIDALLARESAVELPGRHYAMPIPPRKDTLCPSE